MKEAEAHGSTEEGTSSVQVASHQIQSCSPPHAHSREKEIEADLPKFSQLASHPPKPWSYISSLHEAAPFPEVRRVISTSVNSQTRELCACVGYSHTRGLARQWVLCEVILRTRVFSMRLVNRVRWTEHVRTESLKLKAEITKRELELALG